jgi:hypothetical protein
MNCNHISYQMRCVVKLFVFVQLKPGLASPVLVTSITIGAGTGTAFNVVLLVLVLVNMC